jgi:cyclic lactone autoinducer peptide
MKNQLLTLVKLLAFKTATYDANVMCTFIFGQKKLPTSVAKLKKNV